MTKVLVNPAIVDLDGNVVAHVDLLDEESSVAGEYQGDRHREREQFGWDLRRRRGLDSLGLRVVEAGPGDLKNSSRYRRELVAARRQGLARDRSLDRWRAIPREC